VTPTPAPQDPELIPLRTPSTTTPSLLLLRPILAHPMLKGLEDRTEEGEEGEETEEVDILEARALLKPLILLKQEEIEEDKVSTLEDPLARDAPEAVSTANAILPTALPLPRPFSWPTSRLLWTTRVS